MITEDRVMANLADANPVPDVEELDLVQLGTASYLATLEQRSGELTRVDVETDTPKKKDNRNLLVALAAVMALIFGVVAVLLQDDSPPVAEDPVVTTVPQVPTTFPEDAAGDEALLTARTEFLTRFGEALNSGDVGAAMKMFNHGSAPPEIKRHPYGFSTFFDSDAVRNGLELTVAAQGSGAGLVFVDVEVSDGSIGAAPDVIFGWRFDYGADGSESGGEAGCIGGKNGKVYLRNGLISSFDWGFDDPSQCSS